MHITAPEVLPVKQDVEMEDNDIDDPDPVQVQSNECACVYVFNKNVYKVQKILT